jgi:hypothetical protein
MSAAQDLIREVEESLVRQGWQTLHRKAHSDGADWQSENREAVQARRKHIVDHQFPETVDDLLTPRQLRPRNRDIGLARQLRSLLHRLRMSRMAIADYANRRPRQQKKPIQMKGQALGRLALELMRKADIYKQRLRISK